MMMHKHSMHCSMSHRRALVQYLGVVCEQAVHLHFTKVNHGQVLQQTPARALVLQQQVGSRLGTSNLAARRRSSTKGAATADLQL
jgi:hypothetical protein